MKLLLNTESLRPPLTGIGNYTLNLLGELEAQGLASIDCFNGAAWLTAAQTLDRQLPVSGAMTRPSASRDLSASLRSFVRGLPLAYRVRSAVRNEVFRREASKRQAFVYHEPNFILKPHKGPCVATIHDLSFIHYPDFHPAERVAWLSRELPRSLARADYLITDSGIVRQELIDRFDLAPDRVRAIYLGADQRFQPRDPRHTGEVLARHGLVHGRYVAFIGTIEPRKGVSTLLDAWEQLPASLRQEYPLVIAGAPGWQNSDLLERMQVLQARGEIKYLRYVAADELPFIYSGAAVFIYPSLYEGFGLPVLEAMASGVPVVCTDGTSMAEFAQGAVSLFEAGRSEALSEALRILLEDQALRSEFILKGLSQARQFSWARCARETSDVYKLMV